jgi:MFS family permease
MSSVSAVTVPRAGSFLCYNVSHGLSEVAYQMAAVAVGWQIYALSHSALDLGLAGLVQFIPTLLLGFGAGHAADRYDRRRIVAACQVATGLTAAALVWGSLEGRLTVGALFCAVAVFGTATAFESPAAAALLPNVLPPNQLQRGTALATGVFQVASISGPALGGVAFAFAPAAPYALMACCWLIGAVLVRAIHLAGIDSPVTGEVVSREPPSFASLFAGVEFVRRNPTILGAISLDLFAVLLGGATALLPIYTRDILHTGPWGLGVLRATPAIGALLMTVVLAHYTMQSRVGRRLFLAIIVYGCATLIFAISRSFWLSLCALAIMGAADTVSVVIRIALVQLATPDEMRGRVGAVNYLFVNASNQLGEFESGVTAALLGPVLAAALGGIGTIAVALGWMKLFPTLRDLERLEP